MKLICFSDNRNLRKKSGRLHNFLQVFLRLPLGVTCASEHKNFKKESEEFTASLPFDRVLPLQGVYRGRNESFCKTKLQITTLTVVPESFLERAITKKRVEKLAAKILFFGDKPSFLVLQANKLANKVG